jgi:hypothetical protein
MGGWRWGVVFKKLKNKLFIKGHSSYYSMSAMADCSHSFTNQPKFTASRSGSECAVNAHNETLNVMEGSGQLGR